MITALFWNHETKEVIEYSGEIGFSFDEPNYQGLLCVDMLGSHHRSRYGKYINGLWQHIPIELFDPEFRTHLLIKSIS